MEIERLPVLTLAYIGDAVFELYVRKWVLRIGVANSRDLHRLTVETVKAGGQARLLRALEGRLSPAEEDWVRRGRNAKGAVPRTASMEDYRWATGLETMMGYLHLTGQDARLAELLEPALAALHEGNDLGGS